MKKSILLTGMLVASSIFASGVSKADNTSALRTAMTSGKVSGQVRYYYMYEDNTAGLEDYFGSSLGGKLKYETGSLYGFNLGAAFYTTHFLSDNVSSTHTEPTANNKGSRYVVGLLDATNPDNNGITDIGELYLNYKISKTNVTLGRMKLKTPFINPEDGRMIPTLEQGLWVKSKDVENVVLQAGYINAFWNRSTPGWRSVEDSLGFGYAQGKATVGGAAKYKGNTTSDGVYVASVVYKGVPNTKIQVWDYYLENIMNVAYLQADYKKKFGDFKLVVAGQYIAEQEVGEGGNSDDTHPEYSYISKDEKSKTYGAKIGFGYASTMLTLAATKVTSQGRFLFPREWGKEPLFTFQKRERTDGSGDATATLLTLHQDFKVIGLNGLSMLAGIGKYNRVDVKESALNKYGVPSFVQGNIDVRYKFSGALKGLNVEYILARKQAIGDTYDNANFVFRKNDMSIHNLIMNYNF